VLGILGEIDSRHPAAADLTLQRVGRAERCLELFAGIERRHERLPPGVGQSERYPSGIEATGKQEALASRRLGVRRSPRMGAGHAPRVLLTSTTGSGYVWSPPEQGARVPAYLWQASYTTEGVKGLMKEGGTKRKAAIKQMIETAGGKLHAFHFAFGKDDVVGIAEFPDHATATAVSLAVNAVGVVDFRSTVLISPEEMDAAIKKSVAYRPPGSKA
jgi:uncharacterized protein with GYD domain